MFYSGIDQHKRDCFIATYDSDGKVVKQKRIPNSTMLIQHYFGQPPGPHKAAVESTGSWYWLADLLEDLGVDLSLAHTTRLKGISAAEVKTNKIDSDVLALLLLYYPKIRAFYRVKRRKKPERIARTLVALEIARIVYHVLSQQQDFKGKPLSRTKQPRWPRLASPAV